MDCERGKRGKTFINEIPTGDTRMFRNCDIGSCEIQTGDMGTPPNRASQIAFGSRKPRNARTARSSKRKKTRNETVLNGQFENNVLHCQIRTRNKTALKDQSGNNVFDLHIRTGNKAALNDRQFGNNVFDL